MLSVKLKLGGKKGLAFLSYKEEDQPDFLIDA